MCIRDRRTGVGQNYNVRLEGGSRELRWSAGISYNNIAGAMKGSVRNTFSGTINLAYTVKNLRFQNQTMLDYNNSSESKYGSFSQYTELNLSLIHISFIRLLLLVWGMLRSLFMLYRSVRFCSLCSDGWGYGNLSIFLSFLSWLSVSYTHLLRQVV